MGRWVGNLEGNWVPDEPSIERLTLPVQRHACLLGLAQLQVVYGRGAEERLACDRGHVRQAPLVSMYLQVTRSSPALTRGL
jgi:hypothetical protein